MMTCSSCGRETVGDVQILVRAIHNNAIRLRPSVPVMLAVLCGDCTDVAGRLVMTADEVRKRIEGSGCLKHLRGERK